MCFITYDVSFTLVRNEEIKHDTLTGVTDKSMESYIIKLKSNTQFNLSIKK